MIEIVQTLAPGMPAKFTIDGRELQLERFRPAVKMSMDADPDRGCWPNRNPPYADLVERMVMDDWGVGCAHHTGNGWVKSVKVRRETMAADWTVMHIVMGDMEIHNCLCQLYLDESVAGLLRVSNLISGQNAIEVTRIWTGDVDFDVDLLVIEVDPGVARVSIEIPESTEEQEDE